MELEIHDFINGFFAVLAGLMTILLNRFLKLVDEERKDYKDNFNKIDNEIKSMKNEIIEIKVMIGKLQVKNKL